MLVVDDSSTMRMSLIKALNELGFDNIKEAKNGRQALELVRKEIFRPDAARYGDAGNERHGGSYRS